MLLPIHCPPCCSSKLGKILDYSPLQVKILRWLPISFRIKRNFQCDIKGPLLVTSARLSPLWMATRTHSSNRSSFYRLLKALCHSEAFVATALSRQGSPSSPPSPGRFLSFKLHLLGETLCSPTHHWLQCPWFYPMISLCFSPLVLICLFFIFYIFICSPH